MRQVSLPQDSDRAAPNQSNVAPSDEHECSDTDDDDLVIDLRSPTQSAAGVFAVSAEGAAIRLPLRADEYRQLVGHGSN